MRMLFFIGFLVIMLGGLFYALWHVWYLLPCAKVWRWCVVILMAACFLSMIPFLFGVLDRLPLHLASFCYDVSTSSLFIILYLVMIFLVVDMARLVHLLPKNTFHESWWQTGVLAAVMLAIFVGAHIRYLHKVRVPLKLTTSKPLAKSYKMVFLSDLHLGYHNRRAAFSRWVDLINAEHPDLILIAGDIIDNSVRPLREEGMAEEFHRLDAPVYACLGNHEYISGHDKAWDFYQAAGIHLLRDEATVIDSALCLIGRDDRSNPRRKEVKDLAAPNKDGLYTILLDHQPYHLEHAEQSHIDFQLSGHTHRGQVWPISWITDALYECSFGPWQRGGTRYYVSSGIGIWGGKFRIGTQSEYIVATLTSTRP